MPGRAGRRRSDASLALLRPVATARWWRRPLGWWSRSLPLRVTSTVFVASVVVLVLGGFLLMQQATLGVLSGKRDSAANEARQAVNAAQAQLNATDLSGEVNVDKLLYDLASGFATRSGGSEQYQVIISARGQTITAGDATADSIPAALRDAGRVEPRPADDPDRGGLRRRPPVRRRARRRLGADPARARAATRSSWSSR